MDYPIIVIIIALVIGAIIGILVARNNKKTIAEIEAKFSEAETIYKEKITQLDKIIEDLKNKISG